MTPYLVCYAVLIVSLVTGLLLDKLRIAAVVAFVPMFLLIAGRGMVGTDSANYVQGFDMIRYQGVLAAGYEPGFSLLVEVLTFAFRDSFDILIVLGSATAIIMLCAALLLERSPLLFMTIVLPYFLLDMSINGLRYGLAFAIVALGAAGYARGRRVLFIVCCIVAASVQVSSALLAVCLWALLEARIKTFFGAAIGLAVTTLIFGSYLENKISQNADISGLGGFSGIAPLLATILLVAALTQSNPRAISIRLPVIAIIIMQVGSFAISRYYYAGLRLQSLFLFLLYLYAAITLINSKVESNKRFIFVVSLAATLVLSSASRISNFSIDTDGLSPFNPYYFQRELNG